MAITIVVYPPGGGGNHLTNMMMLYPGFGNSDHLNTTVYSESTRPPGTVHSVRGRNVQQVFMERVFAEPDKHWLLHGHFGELATYREQLNSVPDKKYIIISFDKSRDQQLLDNRQHRLGHGLHPYYMSEEQPFLYRPEMYTSYFTGSSLENIYSISLYDVWNPDLKQSNIITRINDFLGISIDQEQAQKLHDTWWKLNFYFDFCNFTRSMYGQARI